jgi:mono/diheme cytochrome c family protein
MLIVIVLFWALAGLAVFLLAMRGPHGVRRPKVDSRPFAETRGGRRAMTLAITLLVGASLAVPALVLAFNGEHKAGTAVGGVHLNAEQQRGRDLFAERCSVCHTLSAVKSVARIGPNLDVRVGEDISTAAGRKALVENAVAEGRARGLGQMPAQLYVGKEAQEVASFVAAVAGH